MNRSQKAAGIGALLQGIFFAGVLVLIIAVLPRFGLQSPNDFADPGKVLPFVRSQPLVAFWLYPGDILFAVFLILTVVGFYERFQNHSPYLVRLATAAGLIATTLILGNGTLGASVVQLAHMDSQNQAAAATIFFTLSLSSSNGIGLVSGGIFAYGSWVVFVSWVALRSGTFSKAVNYVGMVLGIAGIVAIFILPLSFLGPVVGIVWGIWIGAVLLRGRVMKRLLTFGKYRGVNAERIYEILY